MARQECCQHKGVLRVQFRTLAKERLRLAEEPVSGGALAGILEKSSKAFQTRTHQTQPSHPIGGLLVGCLQKALQRVDRVAVSPAPREQLSSETGGRELLGSQLFDCDAIAEWLAGDSSLGAVLANSVCTVGVALLASMVEEYILSLMDYAHLHLQGEASFADQDQDYDRESIADGDLRARWTGASGTLSFDGDMSGVREGDRTGGVDPIRQRLRAHLN